MSETWKPQHEYKVGDEVVADVDAPWSRWRVIQFFQRVLGLRPKNLGKGRFRCTSVGANRWTPD